jgi:hypothetical protein
MLKFENKNKIVQASNWCPKVEIENCWLTTALDLVGG